MYLACRINEAKDVLLARKKPSRSNRLPPCQRQPEVARCAPADELLVGILPRRK